MSRNMTDEEIKKMSTKRLYTILKGIRPVGYWDYDDSYNDNGTTDENEILFERIKKELNTREHIPRKKVVRNKRKSLSELHVKQLKELLNSRYRRRRYFTWTWNDPEKSILSELRRRWFPDKEQFFKEYETRGHGECY